MSKHKQKRLAIESLVGKLWDQFGGAPGVAASWMKAYSEATASRQLRAAESLIALLTWIENDPSDFTGLSLLTEDELEQKATQARSQAMSDFLRSSPEQAIQTAMESGYRLTPIQ